jgi:dGTPase
LTGLGINDVIKATDKRLNETGVKSSDEVQHLPENVICNTPEFSRMNDQVKDFLYDQLYRHYRVARMSEKAYRYVRDLFGAYVKEPAQLPPEVQKRIEVKGLYRAIADYIAGMTDRYALLEWQRLFDPFMRP